MPVFSTAALEGAWPKGNVPLRRAIRYEISQVGLQLHVNHFFDIGPVSNISKEMAAAASGKKGLLDLENQPLPFSF
jgi:hypothetical protein